MNPEDASLYGSMAYDEALAKRCRKYGIEVSDFVRMYRRQNRKCAICFARIPYQELVIDHNHRTGHVRGLLCSRCNTGIGYLHDSPEVVKSGAEYLRVNGSARGGTSMRDPRIGNPEKMHRYVDDLVVCDEVAQREPNNSQIEIFRIKASEHRRAHKYLRELGISLRDCPLSQCKEAA